MAQSLDRRQPTRIIAGPGQVEEQLDPIVPRHQGTKFGRRLGPYLRIARGDLLDELSQIDAWLWICRFRDCIYGVCRYRDCQCRICGYQTSRRGICQRRHGISLPCVCR